MQLAGLVARARTDGEHLAFLRLFLGGVGDDDAAGRLLFGFDAADQDTVMQWTEAHFFPPGVCNRVAPPATVEAPGRSLRHPVERRVRYDLVCFSGRFKRPTAKF